ncbi:hypothetical protein BH10ACI1_BH10ACI1_17030 [soil metagenome]
MTRFIKNLYFASFLLCVVFSTTNCSTNSVSGSANLPNGLVGLKLEMSKEDARKQLLEIGEFISDAKKNQQLWRLKNDSHFSQIAVGFDKENKIRFITAFVEKDKASEQIRFDEVGDLKNAKAEILPPHYRYTWNVSAEDAVPAYFVSIYGDNPEIVTMYSIGKTSSTNEEEEDD